MSAGGVIAIAQIALVDRLKSVRDLLVSKAVIANDRVFLGSQYVEENANPPRITFVPSGLTPSTAPLEMSNRDGGSNKWECKAHIWALNTDDDYGFEQFAALESLLTELQGALRIVAGGRFAMTTITISDETHVLKYGESAEFSFAFQTNFQMVPDTVSIPIGSTTPVAIPRTT